MKAGKDNASASFEELKDLKRVGMFSSASCEGKALRWYSAIDRAMK